MDEIINKLLRLKAPVKAALTIGVLVLAGGLYYVLLYMDLADNIASARSQQQQLQVEKESYEKRKREYVAYRDELRKLQEEQRELLKALPKKGEMATFTQNIGEQAELAGLEVLNLSFEAEVPEQDLYVKIPVKMEVRGTYHSLTKFFKNVSELRRIVNIEGLTMGAERSADTGPPKLRSRFIAATFRYTDKPGAAQ